MAVRLKTMHRSLPFVALLLVGCGTPSTPSTSVVSTPPLTRPKPIEAQPPTNIGDGSSISFTHWKGIRKGSGSLVRDGKTTKIESFDLELNPDQTMTLTLDGSLGDTLKGSWRRKDNKTVEIVVPSVATGTLRFMDRANPYQLSLKGKELTLEFRASE